MNARTYTLTLLLSIITFSLSAQEPKFSFEFNTGASYATRTLGGSDLNIGGGFEGIFQYKIMPHIDVLAGWGWNKFSADNSFAGSDIDFEETGYIFGLQFQHPLMTGDIDYFIRANGLYNHLELENTDGDIIEDTGHGLGWQLAGGLALPITEKFTLTPGIKFNALTRDLETATYSKTLTEHYFSLRVGINISL